MLPRDGVERSLCRLAASLHGERLLLEGAMLQLAIAAKERGILVVEMEAAALYAMAEARGRPVVCFAYITNRMGVEAGDFEKGEVDRSAESWHLLGALFATWSKAGARRIPAPPKQPESLWTGEITGIRCTKPRELTTSAGFKRGRKCPFG
ncbi:MAG: hypothetical protein AB7O66_19825 [Limisphaerales bacterium]